MKSVSNGGAFMWLLGIVFPIRCVGCQAYDRWLCSQCVANIIPCPNALGTYDQPALQRAIHLMKYQGQRGIAVELGYHLAQLVPLDSYDLVVPVPLHWRRRLERGYNQTAILAQQFPKPCLPAVRKRRHTARQATLNRQERLQNLDQVFVVPKRYQSLIQGQRVLLVDDVLSTGATTTACTEALLTAGVASVSVAVVAKNDPYLQ